MCLVGMECLDDNCILYLQLTCASFGLIKPLLGEYKIRLRCGRYGPSVLNV